MIKITIRTTHLFTKNHPVFSFIHLLAFFVLSKLILNYLKAFFLVILTILESISNLS